ncbi:MAG: ankyrin repeat domain-containing protein [PVC group bacterium]
MKVVQFIMIAGVILIISGCASTLQKSASKGDLTKVNELIADGGDVNVRDDEGWTPIYHALQNNHAAVVEALLENGADLNVRDPNGQTPLSLAVVYSGIETVELMIAAGAAVNVADSLGRTPLHNAAIKGRPEIVALLLWQGAEINPQNDLGWTPLDAAVRHRHPVVVAVLLENGAIGYSYEVREDFIKEKRLTAAPVEPVPFPEMEAVFEEQYDSFSEQTNLAVTYSIESLRGHPPYREYQSILGACSGKPEQFYQAGKNGWLIGPWQEVSLSTDGKLYPDVKLSAALQSAVLYFFSDHPAQFKIGDEIIDAVRSGTAADAEGDRVITRGEFLLSPSLVKKLGLASQVTIRFRFDDKPPLTWTVPPRVLRAWQRFLASAERLFQ